MGRGSADKSVYALRPTTLRGTRALSADINEPGLLDENLKDLASLRAVFINGCPF